MIGSWMSCYRGDASILIRLLSLLYQTTYLFVAFVAG